MMDEHLPDKPEVNFEFNLPHGIDDNQEGDKSWKNVAHTSEHSGGARGKPDAEIQEDLDYRQFSPGFSDDEGSGEAFERSWPVHQAKKQAAKAVRGKKWPRRFDDEGEESETIARAKKPRQFMFNRANEETGVDDQVESLFAPATPGRCLGNRMSSMTLDQQQDVDELERPINNISSLACSDIGSVCDSPAPSDDELIIPPDAVPYYELRQNIDRQQAFTHVDTDKSGNFDPEREAKERTAKFVRAKAAKKEKKEKREKRKKKGKNVAPRDFIMKCIVKLPFDAFGNVRNITDDEQNWPEYWSEIDSEQERELEEYRAAFRDNIPDRGPHLPLKDPAGEVDDLTGHPVARSCKLCRKLKQSCSMMKDGKYPCGECVEDGGECQPIQKPAVKGRCRQCDQANAEVCSFENDSTQPICDHCAENDHIYEALPPDSYRAPRVNIEEII